MKELEAWFDGQARRQRRAVALEEAFFGDRFAAYAVWRLRFFLGRTVIACAVHAVRVLLLFEIFAERDMAAVLGAHVVTALLASAWWGGLEEMRARVRHLSRAGRPHVIPAEIGRWLALARRLSGILAVAAVVWAGVHALVGGFGPAQLYLVAVAVRLAVEIPVRCYHSGVYAIRRVYRPLASMVAVDVAGLVGLLALWPWLGRWSFGVAGLASSLIVSAIVIHYTGRLYRVLGFDVRGRIRWRRPRREGTASRAMLAAAASGVMSVDAVLVFGLVTNDQALTASSLAAVLFAMSPALRSVAEWSHLFYFDLKRLEVPSLATLREQFEARLRWVAVVIGVLAWMVAIAVTAAISGPEALDIVLLLLPFFVTRALVAGREMRAFARQSYTTIITSWLPPLVALAILVEPGVSPAALATALTVINLFALAVLSMRQRPRSRSVLVSDDVLSASDWLATLAKVQGPVRIGSAVFDRGTGRHAGTPVEELSWMHRQLAARVARRLGDRGAVAVIHPGQVVWYQFGAGPDQVTRPWIVGVSGGLLESTAGTADGPSGAEALREAASLGVLDSAGDVPYVAPTAEALLAAFSSMIRTGTAWAPGDPPPDGLARRPGEDRRRIIADAVRYGRELRPSRSRSTEEVTAFFEGGVLRLVFVAPGRVPTRARRRWDDVVRQANISAAAAPPGATEERAENPNNQPSASRTVLQEA